MTDRHPSSIITRCLVHLYSTPYLLTALAAILSRHPQRDTQVVVVVHLPGASDTVHAEMRQIVEECSRNFPCITRVLALTDDNIRDISVVGDAGAAGSALGCHLGESHIDEIYYAHDFIGSFMALARKQYPAARRVCLGDAFGMVYERDFLLSYQWKRRAGFSSLFDPGRWRRLFARARAAQRGPMPAPCADSANRQSPDLACLVLPVDPSGRFLAKTPFEVCPRQIFMDVIARCADAAQELRAYIDRLLAESVPGPRYLVMLENYAEAGHLRFNREVEMYCAIIRAHCPPGCTVFLKGHPNERSSRGERVRDTLGSEFRVIPLDTRYRRYPIELWRRLVHECRVISAAYPVLSLKFIYGIDVIQPMDDAFIERWFPRQVWRWLKDGLRLYMEPLRVLPAWDGSTILWSPAPIPVVDGSTAGVTGMETPEKYL